MNMFVLRSGFWVDSGTPRAKASWQAWAARDPTWCPSSRARASFGTALKLPFRRASHLGVRSLLLTLNR